jgi:hypothetical protein
MSTRSEIWFFFNSERATENSLVNRLVQVSTVVSGLPFFRNSRPRLITSLARFAPHTISGSHSTLWYVSGERTLSCSSTPERPRALSDLAAPMGVIQGAMP